jgi:hypothetical protein
VEVSLEGESVTVQACYEYLSRQPYQLWGDWIISHPDRRLEAARWLARQISEVNKVRRKGDWNPV